MAGVALQYLVGASLAAIAGLALLAALVYIYFQIRRSPRELLQLRVFQEVERIGRGLVAMGLGVVGGVLLMLPILLQIDLPAPLYVGAGIPFFVLLVYGIMALLQVFRFPVRAAT